MQPIPHRWNRTQSRHRDTIPAVCVFPGSQPGSDPTREVVVTIGTLGADWVLLLTPEPVPIGARFVLYLADPRGGRPWMLPMRVDHLEQIDGRLIGWVARHQGHPSNHERFQELVAGHLAARRSERRGRERAA